MYIYIFIASMPIFIMYSDMLIQEISTIKACRKIERELYIIRPYITNQEYLIIYSDYRQIDNKEKLINLLQHIQLKAIERKIKLPEAELLGI